MASSRAKRNLRSSATAITDDRTEKSAKEHEPEGVHVHKFDPQTQFYEEELDEEGYDELMIDELFSKKLRFNHMTQTDFGLNLMQQNRIEGQTDGSERTSEVAEKQGVKQTNTN